MTTISEDRLRKAVEHGEEYHESIKSIMMKDERIPFHSRVPQDLIDAADFAARLLVVEPLWEKAREVLRERQWTRVTLNNGNWIHGCYYCTGSKESGGHTLDCAIAELLKEE